MSERLWQAYHEDIIKRQEQEASARTFAFRERLDKQLLHRMPPPDWELVKTLYRLAFQCEPPQPRKRCEVCGGAGELDSGGFTPWGSPINIGCPRCNGSGFEE